MLNAAKDKTDSLSRWDVTENARRGYWKAVVAIAAKNAHVLGRAQPRRVVQAAGLRPLTRKPTRHDIENCRTPIHPVADDRPAPVSPVSSTV